VVIGGAIVEGRLLDPSGHIVPNTKIGIYGPAHPNSSAWVQVVNVGPDGRWGAHVPAGRQRIYCMDGIHTQSDTEVTVADGTVTTLDLTVSLAPKQR